MSSFTEASFTPLSDGKRWRVNEPGFSYGVGSEDSKIRIDVPAGFVTDFASVPQGFRFYVGRTGKHALAAVVHDYLYKTQFIDGTPIERKTADKIFLEAMKVSGVRWTKRRIMYRAVRLFGWVAWGKHREEGRLG